MTSRSKHTPEHTLQRAALTVPAVTLLFFFLQMLTFLMLARLSSLCPSAVLQRLDRLVEPLRATCTTKVGPH